jgi:hypothetical protein
LPSIVQAEVRRTTIPEDAGRCLPEGREDHLRIPRQGRPRAGHHALVQRHRQDPAAEALEADRNAVETGAVVLGDKGTIMYGSHGAGGVRIIPEAKMQEYQTPEPKIPRTRGHHADWLDAIREGNKAGSDFSYGGPLTESPCWA